MSKGTKSVFPKETRVKLVYCDCYTVSTSASIQVETFFRANGPYDPDASIGGHQPLGFDEWSNFYNHYVVDNCTIEVDAKHETTGSEILQQLSVMLSDDTTIPSTPSALREQPLTKVDFFGYQCGDKSIGHVKHYFKATDFFNRKSIKDNAAQLGALVSANPTEQAYFGVAIGKAEGSTGSIDYTLAVKLTYDVIFSEPKALTQS